MKSASCCMLLLALSLTAQTPSEDSAVSQLNSTLLPLAKLPKIPEGNDFIGVPLQKELRQFNKISQQVVEDMMSLADRYHKPTSFRAIEFANVLTRVLAGRDLPVDSLSQLTASIIETLDTAAAYAVKRDFKSKNFMNKKSDSEDRFSASVTQAKRAMLDVGVGAPNAQVVAERLAWMGKSVWLPHFAPVGGP